MMAHFNEAYSLRLKREKSLTIQKGDRSLLLLFI